MICYLVEIIFQSLHSHMLLVEKRKMASETCFCQQRRGNVVGKKESHLRV